jgi:3',5'-cyclic AMP phosphodiesterase CpdA
MTTRFVQITDHHLTEGDLLWGYSTGTALRTVLEHIAAHAGPIDAIVSTGDLTEHGNAAEYAIFRDLIGAEPSAGFPGPLHANGAGLRGVPIYVLPGNHDDRPTLLRSLFPTSAPAEQLHGWFMIGGVRCICLDWGNANQAVATPELYAFLAAALADDTPAILLMHHHIVPMGHPRLDRLLPADVEQFAAQIAERNVLAILSGHTHATFEGRIGATPVYGLRSTCFQFAMQAAPDAPLLRCLQPLHYRIVEVADGRLSTSIVEVSL